MHQHRFWFLSDVTSGEQWNAGEVVWRPDTASRPSGLSLFLGLLANVLFSLCKCDLNFLMLINKMYYTILDSLSLYTSLHAIGRFIWSVISLLTNPAWLTHMLAKGSILSGELEHKGGSVKHWSPCDIIWSATARLHNVCSGELIEEKVFYGTFKSIF